MSLEGHCLKQTCPEGTELPLEMSTAAGPKESQVRRQTSTQEQQSSRGASGPGEGGLDRDVVGKEAMEQERLKFRKFPNLL